MLVHTSRTRRGAALVAVAAAAVVGVSACGSSSGGGTSSSTKLAPEAAAKAGFTGLGKLNATTATLKLDMSAADLKALSALDPTSNLTDAQATAVSGGTIVFALKSGGSSFSDDLAKKDSSGESAAITVNAGGTPNLFQFVGDSKAYYLRADVAGFATLAGSDTSSLEQLATNVPASLKPAVQAALAGKWLKIDATQLKSLIKQSSPSGTPTVSPSQVSALVAAVEKIYTTDVKVTRGDADSSLGDHLILTGNARTIGTDLVSALKTELSTLPGAAQAFASADPSKIPNKDVTVDEYVKDGRVTAIKLGLNQFFNDKEKAAVKDATFVEVDFTDSASIDAPSSSTPVDLSSLGGLLGGSGL